jgi:chromate transporter
MNDASITVPPRGQREATPHCVSLREALGVWARVAMLSFGGPAGQIAVMHRILVDEKRWVSENRFLHVLNYCMLLPGPEAQQLATYIGWLMHRTRGGLIAGGLFILPGIVAIMALSWSMPCSARSGSSRPCSSASRLRSSPSSSRRWCGSANGR